jgi:tryptophan synthase beta chain
MLSTQDSSIIPNEWYNIVPDLPKQLPPPVDRDEKKSSIQLLNQILPKAILKQEFTFQKYTKIPEEVQEIYAQIGRPTPLFRAKGLEKALDYNGKILLKYEGATITGSHKINTAIPQAFYTREEGSTGVVTETGAGQWGTATTVAASLAGITSKIFMVKISFNQKPLRKQIIELYGGEIVPSPSRETKFGTEILSRNPDHPGTLGIAISEAVEYALEHDLKYMLGSVFNSVLTHQSVIGLETEKQLEILGEEPDVLIGCVGGGSNFGGFVFPLMRKFKETKIYASTASEVPKFSKGEYKYDFVDTAKILPSIKMYSLGSDYVPEKIYAGGLRYHGAAPSLSMLVNSGRINSSDMPEDKVIDALKLFARTQGIVAAPESGHAIATAIDYVKNNTDQKETILVNVSGHGLMDMSIFQR